MSVSSTGAQANADCLFPRMSADGRFVVFTGEATNLVPSDVNGARDVFLRDILNSVTELISVSTSGVQGNSISSSGSISADGRFVAFESFANNLVTGDNNGVGDVLMRDRQAGTLTRVSVDSSGAQANGRSSEDSMSADGRFVAFSSDATNLVLGDTNGATDIFVHDNQTGATTRVSLSSSGAQGNGTCNWPAISPDGRYVSFASAALNLVLGDTNGVLDVFVHDRQTGQTTCASVNSSGALGNNVSFVTSISSGGRYVAFSSTATNLVPGDVNNSQDVFVHDNQTGATVRASVDSAGADHFGLSTFPAISWDGRYVSFASEAGLIFPDNNQTQDIFVRDLQTGTTQLVNVGPTGAQADNYSTSCWMSSDGRFVTYQSHATNLITPPDTNGAFDVYVRDRQCNPQLATYCTAKTNSAGCVPTIAWIGTPSTTHGTRFLIGAEQVLPNQTGILIYGVNGPNSTVFQGGFLCVATPTTRTPLQTARPLGPLPCTGRFSYDFNGRIASGVDSTLSIGRPVWAQYWMRDIASPSGTGLTEGLSFVICQ